jgi:hypothetical protein
MAQNLDLDINNYTLPDLERFLQLKGKYTYDALEKNTYKIREVLLKTGHVDKRFKTELVDFLDKAKRWISAAKFEAPPPTVIPSNYRLDTQDHPKSETLPTSRMGDLIQRPDTVFVHAKNDEVFPGNMNPLATRTIHKCVNIDTRFRDNLYATSSSDFGIQLPFKLQKVVSMQLASIELPVSFYAISETYGNNYMWIDVVQDASCSCPQDYFRKRLDIPDGNYNSADLIRLLNDQLQSAGDIFSSLEFVLDITQSGSGTGKVTVQVTPDSQYEPVIKEVILDFAANYQGIETTDDVSTKFGWTLGFLRPKYEFGLGYEGETIIEPAPIRYIYLAVEDYQHNVNNHFVSAFHKSILSPNILARISIKGAYFSLLMENDMNIVSEPRKYFGPVDIQKLQIRLYDQNGRVLNMNGANYSFCLNFTLVYDL